MNFIGIRLLLTQKAEVRKPDNHQTGFELKMLPNGVTMRDSYRQVISNTVGHMAASIVGNIPKSFESNTTTQDIVHLVNELIIL